jgi:hypothetical protein
VSAASLPPLVLARPEGQRTPLRDVPADCTRKFHAFESKAPCYRTFVVNNRKEVIQCLIVYRRGRRHP